MTDEIFWLYCMLYVRITNNASTSTDDPVPYILLEGRGKDGHKDCKDSWSLYSSVSRKWKERWAHLGHKDCKDS
jgi:hypothetical protein